MPESKSPDQTRIDQSAHLRKMPGFRGIRKTYEEVRPYVKSAMDEESFKSPDERKAHQMGSFKTAEQMYPLVFLDKLTGLHNRAWFDPELDRRIVAYNRHLRSQEGKPPPDKTKRIIVLMGDIDHFKWINDAFGHAVGDQALQQMKEIGYRKEEPLARVGGEEFAQILTVNIDHTTGIPEDEQIQLQLIAFLKRYDEKLERDSSQLLADKPANPNYPVQQVSRRMSLSVGLAILQPGDTRETIMRRADLALTEAKKTRHRAIFTPSAPTDPENSLSFQEIYAGKAAA